MARRLLVARQRLMCIIGATFYVSLALSRPLVPHFGRAPCRGILQTNPPQPPSRSPRLQPSHSQAGDPAGVLLKLLDLAIPPVGDTPSEKNSTSAGPLFSLIVIALSCKPQ
ncbi:hypothetical protein BaRGS_00001401 [Batillaria attramentaria]|uniref:Uncharacterized protein n=1 Tax=Batillaria attramentaria TaxID=370345 RepID=A0ABD0M804_9CAEN